MEMTMDEYVEHYLGDVKFAIFLVLTIAVLVFIYAIFYVYSKATTKSVKAMDLKFRSLSERFYEIIFSGTCIIGFMAIYYLIERFVTSGELADIWNEYSDFLLLAMMICAIIFNTLLDHVFVRLKAISKDEMASIRLLGMLYMILIFAYIKFIYQNNNYDDFITYFLTLMVGRFVYFDASFRDFWESIKRAAVSIPLMLLALMYIGLLCLYGFNSGYLLIHNGVITNTFIAHLFMVVAIILLHRIPLMIIRRRSKKGYVKL